MKEQNMKIWKDVEIPCIGDHVSIDGRALGLMPLLKDILSRKEGVVAEYYSEGVVKQSVDATAKEGEEAEPEDIEKKYVDYILSKGGREFYTSLGTNHIFLWEDSIVDLNVSGNWISIRCISQRLEFAEEMEEYFDSQWAPPERTGQIYAIVRQGNRLSMQSLGNAGIPLVDTNYTPKVMEDYKFVVRDLQSEVPSGRITIMRGSPGTGKTHLIRALLMEVPDAMFVLISPEMITSLAGPELLPLLLQYHAGLPGPIALILEDADKCLVSRDKDNINSIQSLLNLGDGILGSLLDLRIIATTNAQELHMEEALMRPGRLSKMLEVGPLDLETARGVFKRLLPDQPIPTELCPLAKDSKNWKMTLAEAYSLARKHGWLPSVRKVDVEQDDNCDYDD